MSTTDRLAFLVIGVSGVIVWAVVVPAYVWLSDDHLGIDTIAGRILFTLCLIGMGYLMLVTTVPRDRNG